MKYFLSILYFYVSHIVKYTIHCKEIFLFFFIISNACWKIRVENHLRAKRSHDNKLFQYKYFILILHALKFVSDIQRNDKDINLSVKKMFVFVMLSVRYMYFFFKRRPSVWEFNLSLIKELLLAGNILTTTWSTR